LVKKLKEENNDAVFLHLDAGGFADFYSDDGPVKTRAILEAYRLMGVAAVNVTAREMAGISRRSPFGEEESEFEPFDFGRYGIPLISANIVEEATGNPFFKPYITVEAGGRTIGVVGITEEVLRTWETADGKRLVTTDPVKAAKPFVDKLAEEADLVILLAYLPKWEIKEVAEALPGVDFILGADGVSATQEVLEIGDTRISYCGSQGQNVGVLSIKLENDGEISEMEHEMVRLETTMPEDEEIKEIVMRAKKEVQSGTSAEIPEM
jgi:2',3'-cyclic-nucleotide 2'-phosphodiesterase (5'-nucleotidase family)